MTDLEQRGLALQVRPAADSPDVSRLTGDLDVVGRAIELGREHLLAAMTEAETAVPAPGQPR